MADYIFYDVPEFMKGEEAPAAQPAPEVAPAVQEPVQLTPDQKKIIEFKQFLNKLGRYNGDVNNPEADAAFVAAMRQLEMDIANSSGNKAIIGVIWQGNRINPATSVQDVSNAINILKQKGLFKSAQTVDTFDMEDYKENGPPLAVKMNPTAEETKTETGDPDESQQIGESVVELPKIASVDDRIVLFSKILYQ